MALIYVLDMSLSADEFDTILPVHVGLYLWSDLTKMNVLFEPNRQHIP